MKKKPYFIVYVTTNLINGRRYVGQHCTYDLNDNYLGSNEELKEDIRKYSPFKFERKIIEYCTDIYHLARQELYWIKEFNALEDNNWYNKDCSYKPNHFWGKKHSNTSKQKMSGNLIGKHPKSYKRWHTEKMGHRKGVKLTKDHKIKIAVSMLGPNNHFFGKHHSPEANESNRQKHLGKHTTEETKQKLSKTLLSLHRKAERRICEHCGKDVAVNIYALFHGDRCKKK